MCDLFLCLADLTPHERDARAYIEINRARPKALAPAGPRQPVPANGEQAADQRYR